MCWSTCEVARAAFWVPGQDLQVPQAEGDHAEEHERDDAEHADAPRQLRRQRRASL